MVWDENLNDFRKGKFCATCAKPDGGGNFEEVKSYQCQRFYEGEWVGLEGAVYCNECIDAAQQEFDDKNAECGFGDCPFGCVEIEQRLREN